VRIADRSPSYFLDDSYDSEASLDDWVIETFGEDSDSEDVDEPQPPPRPPPPAKRQHANSRRPSFPLHYRIMLSIGRRVNNIPRERLYFLLHLVSYNDFHNVFRDFQRIELDKCGKDQLARRGLRRGRSTTRDWLDVSIPVRPAPKSETRELWLWNSNGNGISYPKNCIAKFLSFQCTHLKSIVGHGNARILPQGDLTFVYHIKARYYANPDLHTSRVKIWFSYCTHLTTGRTVRNPHSSLSEVRKRWVDLFAKQYPKELVVRGFHVHPDHFRPHHLRQLRPDAAGVDITAVNEPAGPDDEHDARRAFQDDELARLEQAAAKLRRRQEEAAAMSSSDDE